METFDWRPQKLRFQRTEKNASRARVSGNRCKFFFFFFRAKTSMKTCDCLVLSNTVAIKTENLMTRAKIP